MLLCSHKHMSKVAHYLQEHLTGEVVSSADVRRHLAHDASVLRLVPAMAVYPRDENDVRKTARFCWQLAERGQVVPITARGGGSDTSGAAIGSGVLMLFTAHMNRLLTLDPKKKFVTVEPGVTYDKLEQTLYTHGLFLPPCPSSAAYATIGGGLANNVIGDKSVKYGDTLKYVRSLRVVLANGEIIETGPINKRELSHKMGLSTFEGQIYRELDAFLEENAELIHGNAEANRAAHNGVGYNLAGVKKKDHFDLTPLMIGSQGSLGIITEATLDIEPYSPQTSLALVSLNSLSDLERLLPEVLKLKPSICDMINKAALGSVAKLNPKQLTNVLDATNAEIHLFIEFDGKDSARKHAIKALGKLAEGFDGYFSDADIYESQQRIWKIRESVATIMIQPDKQRRAVPMAENVVVPIDKLVEFMDQAEKIFADSGEEAAMWGHAGSGVVRMQPQLDLAQVGDRQKFFKLSEELYGLTTSLGGSLSANGDGRIRAPYVRSLYGEDFYNLIVRVKAIFDPHNMLNPGVKTASADEVKTMMRSEYSLAHRHEHLPRS